MHQILKRIQPNTEKKNQCLPTMKSKSLETPESRHSNLQKKKIYLQDRASKKLHHLMMRHNPPGRSYKIQREVSQ